MLECVSRTGQICAQYSDASSAWKSCPNIRVIFAHIHSAWNYQKRFMVNGSRGGFSTNQWWCCLFLLIQTGPALCMKRGSPSILGIAEFIMPTGSIFSCSKYISQSALRRAFPKSEDDPEKCPTL